MGQILSIGLETGDLSEFDSTVTDSGDLSVTSGAALGGSGFGLQAVIDDTTAIYGDVAFTHTTNDFRCGFLYQRNTLVATTGAAFAALAVLNTSSTAGRAEIYLQRVGASTNLFRPFAFQVQDSGAGIFIIGATTLSTTDEVFIEYSLTRASSAVANDAVGTLYINGTQDAINSSLDVFDAPAIETLRWGYAIPQASYSGTVYQDRFVLRDDLESAVPDSIGGPYVLNRRRRRYD